MKNSTSRSFIQRILLIGFFFIVIPLLVYSSLIWYRNWQLKLKSIFLEFDLTSDAVSNVYRQWLFFRVYQLDHFSQEEEGGLSGKYIFDSEGKCTFSTLKEMEGRSAIFPEQIKVSRQRGILVFASENPVTTQKEIFVFKKEGNEVRGLSVEQSQWLANLSLGRHFTLALNGKLNGKLVPLDKSFRRNFDVKAAEIADRKFTRIALIRANLRSLAVDDLSALSRRNSIKNFCQEVPDPQTIDFTLSELKAWQQKLSFSVALNMRHHHLALMLPLSQADFALYLKLPESEIAQIEGPPLFRDVSLFLLLILVLGGLSAWVLIRWMSASFLQLSSVMHGVAHKDYTKRYRTSAMGFEVNQLGDHFNHMLEALLDNMKAAEEQKVAKELLTRELEIARDVQKGLLPTEVPAVAGLEWGTAFRPAKEVAGDFYDAFAKDSDYLMVTIADASGKGLSACLYSLILRSLLRSAAFQKEELVSALSHANALLIQDTEKTQDFVTAWVGVFNAQSKTLHYTSAGHPPALLLSAQGSLEELTTEGIALGVTPFEKGEVKSCLLNAGQLLLLYTDGVLEAQNEKGELFGKSRLHQALKEAYLLHPQEVVNKLFEAIDSFVGQAPQHDDIAVLGFKLS